MKFSNDMSTKKEAQKPPDEEEFLPKLESAAQEAAVADGLIPAEPGDSKAAKKPSLRRGKWTSEEESYANRLIYEFKLGLLPLTDGTTLRTFLSKLLNCDPMRISKKFVGQNCIGKVCPFCSLYLIWFKFNVCLVACIPHSKYFGDDSKIWKNLPQNK